MRLFLERYVDNFYSCPIDAKCNYIIANLRRIANSYSRFYGVDRIAMYWISLTETSAITQNAITDSEQYYTVIDRFACSRNNDCICYSEIFLIFNQIYHEKCKLNIILQKRNLIIQLSNNKNECLRITFLTVK